MLVRLIHYTEHDVAEDAKLEEVTKLNSQIERLENVLLAQVKYKCHSLETVRKKRGQVVVEVLINMFQVVLKVARKIFIKEYLLEILLDHSQNTGQLNVTHS